MSEAVYYVCRHLEPISRPWVLAVREIPFPAFWLGKLLSLEGGVRSVSLSASRMILCPGSYCSAITDFYGHMRSLAWRFARPGGGERGNDKGTHMSDC